MGKQNLTILDCTLRDGGYYNNWDFNPSTVQNYLIAMSNSGVDIVELGFRFQPKPRFLGAHAYTSDEYIRTLGIPESFQICVMVNAADLVNHSQGAAAAIDEMFSASKNSPVSLVRIAAHFSEVTACRAGAERLNELGYRVGFNLMQVGGRLPEVLTKVAHEVQSWNFIEVLYFADSLGNMDSMDVSNALNAFSEAWSGAIGIHAHENMGRALTNTLTAIDSGVKWVDATVYGMGRGPGNLRMEYLLLELTRRGEAKYQANALFQLVLGDFQKLIDQHNWGPNLFYFLSAAYNIHPTYVQEMLKAENYNPDLAIAALEQLGKSDANSFTLERLQKALSSNQEEYPGTWSATDWAAGRSVLLVGSGPWVQNHMDMLVNYIDAVEPVVICLNTKTSLPDNQVTAFAACHPFRFAMELEHYRELPAPLIAPTSSFPTDVNLSLALGKIFDYGMSISSGKFVVGEKECIIPHRLVAAYAMALANAAGAREILLAGFDGYENESPLQREMEDLFEHYRTDPGLAPIKSVTPTTYSVPQSSIFSPPE
jgi:4-hydroxy 2-oxovalerate aldolase